MTVGVGGALGFLHPLRSTLVFDGADHESVRVFVCEALI